MEINSGYHVDKITINNQEYTLYAYSVNESLDNIRQPVVPNGDWTKYKKPELVIEG